MLSKVDERLGGLINGFEFVNCREANPRPRSQLPCRDFQTCSRCANLESS